MSNYIIFTDSGCDIPQDILQQWGVKCLDLIFRFTDSDQEYTNAEMPAKEFYDQMRAGRIAKTSAVNMETFKEAYDYAAKCGLQPFTVTSPNFGLADQVNDPWGGGCISLSGPANKEARKYHADRKIPVFAYSSLARGFFSGRVKGDAPEEAEKILEEAAVKGYCCPENFERLRRCEALAAKKGVTVAQIAMAWLFNQKDLDVYALVSSSPANMALNIAASEMVLTEEECKWLDLEA